MLVKRRFVVMTAIITLVVIATITIFSINLAKARHVYEENIILTGVQEFDADADEVIFYAYIQGNNVTIEKRTFSNSLLQVIRIITNNPYDLSLKVINNNPYVVWVALNSIWLYNGETAVDLLIVGGVKPELYTLNNLIYICWLKGTALNTRQLDSQAIWLIGQSVSYYSINNYENKVYIVYTRATSLGVQIYYRVFDGAWMGEVAVAVGNNPHLLATDMVTYIYHKTNGGGLSCYYGSNNDIKLVIILLSIVEEIYTNKDLLIFSTLDGLYFQRINNDGFSDTYQTTINHATDINCFYVGKNDVMITYYIDNSVITKMMCLPETKSSESFKPTLDIITNPNDYLKKNWFEYINDYNSETVESQGVVRNFILAHSGESLLFLAGFIIVIVVVVSLVIGKRTERKTVSRPKRKEWKISIGK